LTAQLVLVRRCALLEPRVIYETVGVVFTLIFCYQFAFGEGGVPWESKRIISLFFFFFSPSMFVGRHERKYSHNWRAWHVFGHMCPSLGEALTIGRTRVRGSGVSENHHRRKPKRT